MQPDLPTHRFTVSHTIFYLFSRSHENNSVSHVFFFFLKFSIFHPKCCRLFPMLVFLGFSVVPSLTLANLPTWKATLREFSEIHAEDMLNIASLSAELDLWERLWTERREKQEDIPQKISDTLQFDPASFPNIFTILKVLGTIPVT